MLLELKISLGDHIGFKTQALAWAADYKTACYFDSNNFADPYSAFDILIAAGSSAEVVASAGDALDKLQAFIDAHKTWAIGFLGYDLKNEIESLTSKNKDHLHFPDLCFFVPEHLILIKGNEIQISSPHPDKILQAIKKYPLQSNAHHAIADIKTRFLKPQYIETVQRLQQHILRGDIYEVNFCQEFFAKNVVICPLEVFKQLNQLSPTPFSAFFKVDEHYIISATPERFLSKRGNKLISQPIKGTAKRSKDSIEDSSIKELLKSDEKEKAENVMIVDLVRNDLTKCAIPGTVQVEELFGIYSFEQVHQMISTVVCEASENCSASEILRATFPMGSMTGAPKVSAMQLIEKYEKTKRGAYSGAVGYFAPNGDFDFNVVIRSLLYNAENKYLSFQVGSAITYESEPEKEYEECLLKAGAILQVLKKN